MRTTTAKTSKSKWLTIKTGTGRVTGYIEAFWCASGKMFVTIPGVSRFADADGVIA